MFKMERSNGLERPPHPWRILDLDEKTIALLSIDPNPWLQREEVTVCIQHEGQKERCKVLAAAHRSAQSSLARSDNTSTERWPHINPCEGHVSGVKGMTTTSIWYAVAPGPAGTGRYIQTFSGRPGPWKFVAPIGGHARIDQEGQRILLPASTRDSIVGLSQESDCENDQQIHEFWPDLIEYGPEEVMLEQWLGVR